MKLYKVLSPDGFSCHGGDARWNLPAQNEDGFWVPGAWMPPIEGPLKPCKNGYHLCRPQDLVLWLNNSLYEAEYRGELIECSDKVVVRECRLLRRVKAWDTQKFLFGCECAAHILHCFESEYPDDQRPRQLLQVARRYFSGEAAYDEWRLAVVASDVVSGEVNWPRKPYDFGRIAAWYAVRAVTSAVCRSVVAVEYARAAANIYDRHLCEGGKVGAEQEWQTRRLLEILGE